MRDEIIAFVVNAAFIQITHGIYLFLIKILVDRSTARTRPGIAVYILGIKYPAAAFAIDCIGEVS